MSVAQAARDRGVTRILHYTHQSGVMGAIMKRAVLSRQRVECDPDVAFVYEGVWARIDPDWVDTISMSVERINADLLRRSREHFPEETWWGVLAFSPDILDHPGVVFTDQNNAYEEHCARGEGVEGFEAMFADRVTWGHYDTVARRNNKPDCWPTHRSAEVLYPGELSLEHLIAVHVPGKQHRFLVNSWTDTYGLPDLPVVVGEEIYA